MENNPITPEMRTALRAYSKQWRDKNPERTKEIRKKWRDSHKDDEEYKQKQRDYHKKYYHEKVKNKKNVETPEEPPTSEIPTTNN